MSLKDLNDIKQLLKPESTKQMLLRLTIIYWLFTLLMLIFDFEFWSKLLLNPLQRSLFFLVMYVVVIGLFFPIFYFISKRRWQSYNMFVETISNAKNSCLMDLGEPAQLLPVYKLVFLAINLRFNKRFSFCFAMPQSGKMEAVKIYSHDFQPHKKGFIIKSKYLQTIFISNE